VIKPLLHFTLYYNKLVITVYKFSFCELKFSF